MAEKQKNSSGKSTMWKKIAVIVLEAAFLAILCVGIHFASFAVRILDIVHSDPGASASDPTKVVSGDRSSLAGIGADDQRPHFSTGGETAATEDPGSSSQESETPRPTPDVEPPPTDPPTEPPTLPPDTLEGMKGYLTIAAFGIDSGANYRVMENGEYKDWMNGDVVMIMALNLETYELKLVSVYRDDYVRVPGDDRPAKMGDLFTRYSYYNHNSKAAGGEGCTAVLNYNLDLNITDYVVVNWNVVADAVDMMGGLEVPVSLRMAREMNGYITETMLTIGRESGTIDVWNNTIYAPDADLDAEVPILLDGVQTVAYCRVRNVGGNDYARTQRQRYILGLMLQKAKQQSLSTLMEMVEVLSQEIYTNIDNSTIVSLAMHVIARNPRITFTDSDAYPHEHYWTNYYAGYVYTKNVLAAVTRLHQFLYGDSGYTPSATIHAIQEHIDYMLNNGF